MLLLLDTEDHGLLGGLNPENDDWGSIFTRGQTNEPFGLFKISGAADVQGLRKPSFTGNGYLFALGGSASVNTRTTDNTILFQISGAADTPFSFRHISTGVLFSNGFSGEAVAKSYNQSSVAAFSSVDYGQVSTLFTGTLIDNGGIALPTTGGEVDYGSVVFDAVTGSPFGLFRITGSTNYVYKPEFAQTTTGSLFFGGASINSFLPNWVGSGSIDLSGGDGYNLSPLIISSGGLFTIGGAAEKVTFDYNLSSTDVFGTEDWGLLSQIPTATEDFASILDGNTQVYNYGTIFHGNQTNTAFGSAFLSGAAVTAWSQKTILQRNWISIWIQWCSSRSCSNRRYHWIVPYHWCSRYTVCVQIHFNGSSVQQWNQWRSSHQVLQSFFFSHIYIRRLWTGHGKCNQYRRLWFSNSTIDWWGSRLRINHIYFFNWIAIWSIQNYWFYCLLLQTRVCTGWYWWNHTQWKLHQFVPTQLEWFWRSNLLWRRRLCNVATYYCYWWSVHYWRSSRESHVRLQSVLYRCIQHSRLRTSFSISNCNRKLRFCSRRKHPSIQLRNYFPRKPNKLCVWFSILVWCCSYSWSQKTILQRNWISVCSWWASESKATNKPESTVLFSVSGSPIYNLSLRTFLQVLCLELVEQQESHRRYNQSSVVPFSTEDLGLISTAATTTEDYGQLSNVVTDYDRRGTIILDQTTGVPFGSITISATTEYVYKPNFLQIGSGSINLTGNSTNSFLPNWNGSGSISLSGGDGYAMSPHIIVTGGLFSNGIVGEAVTKHYNISSVDVYSVVDYGSVPATAGSTDDYGLITDDSTRPLNFGSISTRGQNNEPFGLFQISGAAVTAGLRKPSYNATGTITFSGTSPDSFIPNYESTGLFRIAGSAVPNFAFVNPAEALLTVDIQSDERRTYHYNDGTVTVFSTEDLGLISNNATTLEDNGSITGHITGYDNRGFIRDTSTVRSASGTITISGSVDDDFIAENAHTGSGTITFTSTTTTAFIPTGSVLVYSTSVVEMLMHSLSYRLLLVVCLQTELLAKQSPNITTSRLSRRSQQKIMDRSLLLRRRQKIMV